MKKEDVENLRHLGFTDEQVLSVVLITCYFNSMNRAVEWLGVELEPGVVEEVAGSPAPLDGNCG